MSPTTLTPCCARSNPAVTAAITITTTSSSGKSFQSSRAFTTRKSSTRTIDATPMARVG